jgi:lipid II:glycine glycyltransferase (peptidoglycan interpeptide bridge formation enzyme)
MLAPKALPRFLPKHQFVPTIADGFSVETDTVGETQWDEILRGFSDANIYQTWPYAIVRSGRANVTHLVLKRKGAVVAAVQARLAKIPFLNFGIAYVFWGPLWKQRDTEADAEVFRQALRAIRADYVGRRRMVVRIVPNLPDLDNGPFRQIFEEEGYIFQRQIKRRRTILMDIRPPMEQLYRGLHQKWRNHLHKARKQNLELIEGAEDGLFEAFEGIYAEMVDRKRFVDSTNPGQFRTVQRELVPDQKMKVFLCKAEERICAGRVCSVLGDTGIDLFGATGNRGMLNNASYLIYWRILEWLKSCGCEFYDLNGISPAGNPEVYEFKLRFAGAHGRDVHLLGGFDAYPGATTKLLVATVDPLRSSLKTARARLLHLKPRRREKSEDGGQMTETRKGGER